MATQDLSGKKRAFMSRNVAAVQALLAARATLLALKTEWDAENYGNAILQADIDGPNVHLTPAILASGMVSQINLETMLAAGNLTNFMAMVP